MDPELARGFHILQHHTEGVSAAAEAQWPSGNRLGAFGASATASNREQYMYVHTDPYMPTTYQQGSAPPALVGTPLYLALHPRFALTIVVPRSLCRCPSQRRRHHGTDLLGPQESASDHG